MSFPRISVDVPPSFSRALVSPPFLTIIRSFPIIFQEMQPPALPDVLRSLLQAGPRYSWRTVILHRCASSPLAGGATIDVAALVCSLFSVQGSLLFPPMSHSCEKYVAP